MGQHYSFTLFAPLVATSTSFFLKSGTRKCREAKETGRAEKLGASKRTGNQKNVMKTCLSNESGSTVCSSLQKHKKSAVEHIGTHIPVKIPSKLPFPPCFPPKPPLPPCFPPKPLLPPHLPFKLPLPRLVFPMGVPHLKNSFFAAFFYNPPLFSFFCRRVPFLPFILLRSPLPNDSLPLIDLDPKESIFSPTPMQMASIAREIIVSRETSCSKSTNRRA